MKFVRDQYGTPLCPVPTVEWAYDDNGDSYQPQPAAPCGEEMRVDWAMSCSVPEEGERMEARDAAEWAVCTAWEVTCARGHTLARSSGEENAEPFSWTTVLGPWEEA